MRTSPTSLVILSVLKPVDDVRMYRKLGRSLARGDRYGVNIVGFRSKANPSSASVRFHPVFDFDRLSLRRLLANYVGYRTLRRISPKVIILTTPELYPAVWWYRRRHGARLVYDMVENYRRNVRYNRGFASVLVALLARLIAVVEEHLLRHSNLILLAERGYLRELTLPPDKPYQTIENKALKPADFSKNIKKLSRPLSLIYTGTVSEVYGIRQAVTVAQALIEQTELPVQLTILGHVPQPAVHAELRTLAEQHPWLVLRTSERPVPHDEILALIRQADFGIVSHQPVPSIAHCFPTRIWEYMAYRLPFLLQDHPYWTDYCRPWRCAIALDFNHPNVVEVKRQMMRTDFYPRGVPEDIGWEGEEKKLVEKLAAM